MPEAASTAASSMREIRRKSPRRAGCWRRSTTRWLPTPTASAAARREAFVGAYCDQAPLTNAEQNQLQSGIDAVLKHFGWA